MTLENTNTLEVFFWTKQLRSNPRFYICKGEDGTGDILIKDNIISFKEFVCKNFIIINFIRLKVIIGKLIFS